MYDASIRNSRDWRTAKSFYFASNTRQCHIWLDTLVNNWYTITHPSSVKGLSAQSLTICLRGLDPPWFIGLDTIRCAICHCWRSGPLKAIVNQKWWGGINGMRYISFVFIVGNFQFNLPSQDWPGVSNNIVIFDTILQIAPKFQKLDKHI